MSETPTPKPGELSAGSGLALAVGLCAVIALVAYLVAPGLFQAGTPVATARPAQAAAAKPAVDEAAIMKRAQDVVTVEIAKFDRDKDMTVDGRDWAKLDAGQKQECAMYVVNGFFQVTDEVAGKPADDGSPERVAAVRKTADAAVPLLDADYRDPQNAPKPIIGELWRLQLAAQLLK